MSNTENQLRCPNGHKDPIPTGDCAQCNQCDSLLLLPNTKPCGFCGANHFTDDCTGEKYPVETLEVYNDNGTMPRSLGLLQEAVVGRRIVSVEEVPTTDTWRRDKDTLITLDDGRIVRMQNSSDCCAYTELREFLLHPSSVDHVITGIGTTGGYTTWHIFADMGDVLELTVGWSCGNPFYYGYGFYIQVEDPDTQDPTEGENP